MSRPFHRLSLVWEAIMGIRRAEGQPGGVRVPEPRRVFLPWVAGRRCSSSCCCFWQLPPPPPPQRPSRRAMRLVVRTEGAGTSGREREQPGEGAGGDGSGWPRPIGAGLGPAEQQNTKLVSMGASGHVCVCVWVSVCVSVWEESWGFRFHSLTLLNSPSNFTPSKLLLTVCFLRK